MSCGVAEMCRICAEMHRCADVMHRCADVGRGCTGVQMSCGDTQLYRCHTEMHRCVDVMQGCTGVQMSCRDAQLCVCRARMHSCMDATLGCTAVWMLCRDVQVFMKAVVLVYLYDAVFLQSSLTPGSFDLSALLFYISPWTSERGWYRSPICVVLGVPRIPLTNNLGGGTLYLALGFFIWQTIIPGRSIIPLHRLNPIKLFYIKIWIVSL